MTPLTEENIQTVVNNLSWNSLFEAAVFGLSKDAIIEQFKGFIGKPFTSAFYQDGVPYALIALEPIGELKWKSHFIFIDNMTKAMWLAITKFLKGFSNEITKDGGTIEMETPLGRYEKIDTWYRTLGFILVSLSETDHITKYRYVKGRR